MWLLGLQEATNRALKAIQFWKATVGANRPNARDKLVQWLEQGLECQLRVRWCPGSSHWPLRAVFPNFAIRVHLLG